MLTESHPTLLIPFWVSSIFLCMLVYNSIKDSTQLGANEIKNLKDTILKIYNSHWTRQTQRKPPGWVCVQFWFKCWRYKCSNWEVFWSGSYGNVPHRNINVLRMDRSMFDLRVWGDGVRGHRGKEQIRSAIHQDGVLSGLTRRCRANEPRFPLSEFRVPLLHGISNHLTTRSRVNVMLATGNDDLQSPLIVGKQSSGSIAPGRLC